MKIAVMVKMCNFAFGKPSSVPGNRRTAHMLKVICFTALVMNCESVFLRLSEQARTILFHFSGEEVRSNSRKCLRWFFFSCLSLNLPLVSINPRFNSRTFKIFAEYVASWQLLKGGQVLYFAAKNKILKVLAISAQLQTCGPKYQNYEVKRAEMLPGDTWWCRMGAWLCEEPQQGREWVRFFSFHLEVWLQ